MDSYEHVKAVSSAIPESSSLMARLPTSDGLTMSSREIAELANKRHDNVMADIRNMLESLAEG